MNALHTLKDKKFDIKTKIFIVFLNFSKEKKHLIFLLYFHNVAIKK